jgi:hypothetical protein
LKRGALRYWPGIVPLGLALGLLGSGCSRQGEELLIVTAWPQAERKAMDQAFHAWVDANPATALGPVRLRWIPLQPGADPTRIVRRRRAPDLLVGVEQTALRRLARERRLLPIERTNHPHWCVTRRAPIVLVQNPKVRRARAAGQIETVAFDDFRHDPVSLDWAQGELAIGTWAEGYARLVRRAGDPRRIGRQPGSALAAYERGEVAVVPWVRGRPDPVPAPVIIEPEKPIEWVEGVAVIRGGQNPALAQEFVRFLAERGQADSPPNDDPQQDPEVRALLAELLGATLVDAQDELWAAWDTLAAAGHPGRAERWMTEPPPWPPASVDKLLKRGEDGAALLETLAIEIAPEADVRNWLLQSWLAPSRPIDGRFLAELARALGGRVVREPRVRNWLRSEWTAWARQRYRRVARLAMTQSP